MAKTQFKNFDVKNFVLLTGTANEPLAKSVAKNLKTTVRIRLVFSPTVK